MFLLQCPSAMNPMMMVMMPMLLLSLLAISIRRGRFLHRTAERFRPRLEQRKLPIIIRLRSPDSMAMSVEFDIRAPGFWLAQLSQVGRLRDRSRRGLPHAQLGGRVEERERHAAGAAYEPLLFLLCHGVGRAVCTRPTFCEDVDYEVLLRRCANPESNSFIALARAGGVCADDQEESWDSPQLCCRTNVVYTRYDDRQQADGPRCGARWFVL